MRCHVQKTVANCFAVSRQLRSIRRSVPTSVYHTLVVALFLSRLDYGNAVLVGLPAYLYNRLQSVVLNAAERSIANDQPTTLRPHHRHTRQFLLVEGLAACSVQAGDNRVSFVERYGSLLPGCRSVPFVTARCTLMQSAVFRSHVVCLSVRPSVTLVDSDHTGWNSSKIISRLVSLGCYVRSQLQGFTPRGTP